MNRIEIALVSLAAAACTLLQAQTPNAQPSAETKRLEERGASQKFALSQPLASSEGARASIPDGGSLTSPSELAAPKFAEGELLVRFKDGPESYAAWMAHAGLGAEVSRTFATIGWQRVRLPNGMSVAEGLAYYQSFDSVTAAEPNWARRSAGPERQQSPTEASSGTMVPNDPEFARQWNLQKIGAPAAWAVTTGSTSVVVAVLCTGVDYTHEDLAANMWRNPGEAGLDEHGKDKATNGIDDDDNGYVDDVYGIDTCNHDSDPMDDHGHDTGTAGIIGAVGNNGKGIAGLNWSVQIMAVKSHCADGLAFDSSVIEGFEYVTMMRKRGVNVRVTNNSYGGDENGQAIKDAIDAAGNEGILNVFAATNAGTDNDVSPVYPASFDSPSILAVTGTDWQDALQYNYGRESVDLAAPCSVPTTALRNNYTDLAGSSSATPQVAGAAALLLSVKPDLSVGELKAALLGTVDLVPGLSNKVVSSGRLNVARALQLVVDSSAPAIVTSVLPCGNRTPRTASVELTFTKPMDRANVEAGFSIQPTVAGTFEWSNNDRTVTFTHSNPFGFATNYACRLLGSVKDATGATLDGNDNRVAQGTPLDDFTWGFRSAPANDDFANAEPIDGGSGRVTGSSLNATKEPDEPKHAHNEGGGSVWYRWTAPSGENVTFDTAGTEFDTLLGVYAGETLETLTEVASNDDYGGLTTSQLAFLPTAGWTYWVAMDGKVFPDINLDAAPEGFLRLNWYPTPSPAFQPGSAFTPSEGEWGTQVTLLGTNFTGVTAVLFDGVLAEFANASDMRITATVPVGALNGPITVQTQHGNATSPTGFAARAKAFYTVSRTEPALQVDWAGNGFVLESSTSLEPPAWQPVSQTPTILEGGTRQVVVLPFEGSARFFRWRKD